MSRSQKLLDQIIIIDLESTCWEDAPPASERSEIIEIGVCTLDAGTGERLEQEGILVKPVYSCQPRRRKYLQPEKSALEPAARRLQQRRLRHQHGLVASTYGSAALAEDAEAVGHRTYELSELLVDVLGVRREVNIACILDDGQTPDDCVGAWVLVHVGFALNRIDEDEARLTLQLLQQLGDAQAEFEAYKASVTA